MLSSCKCQRHPNVPDPRHGQAVLLRAYGFEDTHIHMNSFPFSAMRTGVWKQANQQRRGPRVRCVGADLGPGSQRFPHTSDFTLRSRQDKESDLKTVVLGRVHTWGLRALTHGWPRLLFICPVPGLLGTHGFQGPQNPDNHSRA